MDELLDHPWIEKFREEIELEYEDEIVHRSSHNGDNDKGNNSDAMPSGGNSIDGSQALGTPSFE